jgi:hypothetical protein
MSFKLCPPVIEMTSSLFDEEISDEQRIQAAESRVISAIETWRSDTSLTTLKVPCIGLRSGKVCNGGGHFLPPIDILPDTLMWPRGSKALNALFEILHESARLVELDLSNIPMELQYCKAFNSPASYSQPTSPTFEIPVPPNPSRNDNSCESISAGHDSTTRPADEDANRWPPELILCDELLPHILACRSLCRLDLRGNRLSADDARAVVQVLRARCRCHARCSPACSETPQRPAPLCSCCLSGVPLDPQWVGGEDARALRLYRRSLGPVECAILAEASCELYLFSPPPAPAPRPPPIARIS